MFGRIQSCQTGGQLYHDTSPSSEYSLAEASVAAKKVLSCWRQVPWPDPPLTCPSCLQSCRRTAKDKECIFAKNGSDTSCGILSWAMEHFIRWRWPTGLAQWLINLRSVAYLQRFSIKPFTFVNCVANWQGSSCHSYPYKVAHNLIQCTFFNGWCFLLSSYVPCTNDNLTWQSIKFFCIFFLVLSYLLLML